ncbi:MAG: hypothetical protein WBM41_15110 [Arenicellales bacterium]
MKKHLFTTIVTIVILASSTAAFSWNLGAKNINALRFEKDGTILFTLFESGNTGPEYICDITLDFGDRGKQWFQISPCDIGKGKGNKSASPSCLSSVDRMAEMLLKAKLEGVPVHVTRETNPDRCGVTETALKPLP